MKGRKRKVAQDIGWCVLQQTADRLLLAFSPSEEIMPQFVAKEMAENSWAEVLKQLVKDYKLQGLSCTYLLNPSDYRVFLADPPNVPPEERYNALRFLVQELIDYPVEESVVDAFDIPVEINQATKAYLVAAKMSELQAIIDTVDAAELVLKKISITELGLAQLLAMRPDAYNLQALLYSEGKVLRLLLTQQGEIRMVRDVGSTDELMQVEQCSRLVAALQRSFEFYQSYLGAHLPMQLLLPDGLYNKEEWRTALAQVSTLPLVKWSLPSLPELEILEHTDIAGLSIVGEVVSNVASWSEHLKGGVV